MKKIVAVGVALCVVASALGCHPQTRAAPPDIPMIQISYARHLHAARHCSNRGVTDNPYEAAELGANVLLVFYSTVESSATTDAYGVTTTSVQEGFWAQALRCPDGFAKALRNGAAS